jgi:hypothetical protein
MYSSTSVPFAIHSPLAVALVEDDEELDDEDEDDDEEDDDDVEDDVDEEEEDEDVVVVVVFANMVLLFPPQAASRLLTIIATDVTRSSSRRTGLVAEDGIVNSPDKFAAGSSSRRTRDSKPAHLSCGTRIHVKLDEDLCHISGANSMTRFIVVATDMFRRAKPSP